MSILEDKKQKILDLVAEYIKEKNQKEWNKDKDWVSYSGPVFDEKEYKAICDVMVNKKINKVVNKSFLNNFNKTIHKRVNPNT